MAAAWLLTTNSSYGGAKLHPQVRVPAAATALWPRGTQWRLFKGPKILKRMADEADRTIISVQGSRLAQFAQPENVPSWKDLGLDETHKAASDWYKQRSQSLINDVVWSSMGVPWAGEVHGLFGIGAELVFVAIEAEVEKNLLSSALETERVQASRAWRARSLRTFAEVQLNNLTSFGHLMANLTVRTLPFHADWNVESIEGLIDPEDFLVGSNDRRAWISFNKSDIKRMGKAEKATFGATPLRDALQRLRLSPAWRQLEAARGQQYHRWRYESPGVDARNLTDDAPYDRFHRDEGVGFTGRAGDYTEGEANVSHLASISREALNTVGAWMPCFFEAWAQAIRAADKSHHPDWPAWLLDPDE